MGPFSAESKTEDCLFINVFTATSRSAAEKRLRPVMVWIYGGGLIAGESDSYDPSQLVVDGDVVAVTFNYRVGPFGFMAHPALYANGKTLANFGFEDQQLALQWVKDNARAFGGDPENVTIFGESAGGRSVLAHLASPGSAGLFHRAIIQSGAGVNSLVMPTLEVSEKVGQDFAKAIGCPNQEASCMRSRSVHEILANGDKTSLRPGATIDGVVLPVQIGESLAFGRFNKVPVINGSTRNEFTWFVALFGELVGKPPLTASEYAKTLRSLYGDELGVRVHAQYPTERFASPSAALAAAWGDQDMICSQRRLSKLLAASVPTFSYEFADQAAPSYFPAVSFPYLAGHTQELQYLFTDHRGAYGKAQPYTAAQRALSKQMRAYWTSFARSGRPGTAATPPWPPYTPQNAAFLSLLGPTPALLPDQAFARAHHCAFWDEVAAQKESSHK